jgi:hypothetical protein
MPRPKSDLRSISLYLSPLDRERAERIAERLELFVSNGPSMGKPDRSAAIRAALEIADRETAKKSKKKAT